MSFVFSSVGATSSLGEAYVALPVPSGVSIHPLKELDIKNSITKDEHAQLINVPHPFKALWSENSAHIVIITADYIYLYKCVAVSSTSHRFSWNWNLIRSVDAPRNLLAFHAGYSHPLLSLEQSLSSDVDHNVGIGEVVVINLLCSLFQTFSVATPTLHPLLLPSLHSHHTPHYNSLSYSGRYLTTAQSFNSPSTGTNTASADVPAAALGIRVYDLLDLWVLHTPTEASYLDFKYADLGVDNAYTTSVTSNTSNNTTNTATTCTNTTVADPLVWAVRQVQWKQSDRFSLSDDAHELFFVANTIPSTTVTSNNTSSATNNTRNNRYSIGIADRHTDYSPTVESPYTPYTPYTPHTPYVHTSTSGEVSVSIYSVSQQPDLVNINILTMAYHAAIVAGQLNQEEYSSASSSASAVPNTPHIGSVEETARTTIVNLLVVVTLDALCREINGDYSFGTDSGSSGSVLFAWVEQSSTTSTTTGSVHGARKHRDSSGGAALWLSAVYDTGTSGNSTSTVVGISGSSSTQYAVLLCGLQHQSRADSCNDRKQYSYTPVHVYGSSAGVSVQEPYSHMRSVRCVGNVSGVGSGGDRKHSSGVPVDMYMIHSSDSSSASSYGGSCVLFSALFMQLSHNSNTTTDSNTTSGMVLTDWCTHLLPLSSNHCLDPHTTTDINTHNSNITNNSTNTTSNSRICTEQMFPSSTVHLTPVDALNTIYTVTHTTPTTPTTNTTHPCTQRTTELLHLNTDVPNITRMLTACAATDTSTGNTMLYALYTKTDGEAYLGVWSFPSSTSTSTLHTIQSQQALHDTQYYSTLPTVYFTPPTTSTSTASTTNTAPYTEYTASITPDPHFGLGIRIDAVRGRTVVSSFKRHPVTNRPMSAQLAGSIVPGDEFLAINGRVLRGLPLADVIHAIRAAVSEGGGAEVLLSMQRLQQPGSNGGTTGVTTSANTNTTNAITPNTTTTITTTTATTTSTPLTLNTSELQHVSSANSLPQVTSTSSMHQVSSVNSIASVLSTASLTDGLDSADSAKYNNNTSSGDINGNDTTSSSGVCVPLCSVWVYVGETPLGSSVLAADLCVVHSSISSSGDGSDGSYSVFVASLQRTDANTCSVALSSCSVDNFDSGGSGTCSSITVCELSKCVYTPCSTSSGGSDGVVCTVQLWSSSGVLTCTVLEHAGTHAHIQHAHTSTNTTITSKQLPLLTVCSVDSAYGIHTHCTYDCILVIDSHTIHTTHTTHNIYTPCMLTSEPDTTTLTSTMYVRGHRTLVQLRAHHSNSNNTVVPLYLSKHIACNSSVICRVNNTSSTNTEGVNLLEVFTLIFNTLQPHTADGSTTTHTSNTHSTNTVVSWLQRAVQSESTDPLALLHTLLTNTNYSSSISSVNSSSVASTLLQGLCAYFTLLNTDTTTNNTSITNTSADLVALQLNASATSAITLAVLLHSCHHTLNTTGGVFVFPGAVVAGLLFGGTAVTGFTGTSSSGSSTQDTLLQLLIPLPTTTTTSNTTTSTSTLQERVRTLLTTTTSSTTSSTTASTNTTTTNTADTNDNTYINFTATTNTNIACTTTIDILAHLTSIHAALWLHDITPLIDVIYRHAMAAFRVHKSSIQIFLEMVLVHREDTLLQLCKTDRSKTGKQLLALLTLDDSFESDSARRKLQKNAFALMKLHRYRDAAAVFLLARPPFVKEACSVLCRQYEDVHMGLLVGRLAEMRIGSSVSSSDNNGSSGVNSNSTVPPLPLQGVEGFALGPVSRQLVQSDLLPLLLNAVESSALCSVQTAHIAFKTTTAVSSSTSGGITGVDAVVLALVAALWVQDRAVLRSTLYNVLHRYSLVDCVAAAHMGGGDRVTSVAAQVLNVLGSVEWLLQLGAYLGAKHYRHVLCAVQEFVTQNGLHSVVLNTALYNTGAVRAHYVAKVRDNVFLLYCARCYTEYTQYVLQQEKRQLEVQLEDQGESAAAEPVPLIPATITPTATHNRGGGFNFASMVRPSGTKTSGDIVAGSDADNTGSARRGVVNALDLFDMPPPPRRTTTRTTISNTDTTSTAAPTVSTTATTSSSSVVATDPFAFDFAPPARHTRAARSSVTNSASSGGSAGSVAGSNESVYKNDTPNNCGSSGSSGVSNNILDATFDFPAPVRHTRTNTAPTSTRDVTASTGISTSAVTDTTNTNSTTTNSNTTTTTTTPITSTTPAPTVKFSFAKPDTGASSAGSVSSAGGDATKQSSSDPFAAFDFEPPARHTRAATRSAVGSAGGRERVVVRGATLKSSVGSDEGSGVSNSSGSADTRAAVDQPLLTPLPTPITGTSTAGADTTSTTSTVPDASSVEDLFSGMIINTTASSGTTITNTTSNTTSAGSDTNSNTAAHTASNFNFANNTNTNRASTTNTNNTTTTTNINNNTSDTDSSGAVEADFDFSLFAPPTRPRRANTEHKW